jgi:hypothetical protein
VQDWVPFATVAGAAAASLTGLLFVAVSIRIDVIARSPELTNRAAQALLLFLLVVFVAIVLAIPGQAYGPLGGEVIALALIAGVGLFVLDRRARSDTAPTSKLGHILDVVAPNTLTALLLLISGLFIAAGVHTGLYIMVVPVVAVLGGGVVSAWLLLIRTTDV